MPDNNLIAAAIMANKTAWSILVKVLAANGALDLHTLSNELRYFQMELQEAGEMTLAEALDEHIASVENWQQADDNH
ncbi:hypothetical protein GID45_24605 [Salmonella enterica]|nr:hypothetical protein [Salmonella enterica subsp. enterica serovar Richmond]ECI7964139.1 hypothetical protein [Salmonella enterica subsp. enterica]EEO0343719.1 hypothetical protein [Salmonella enterica]HAG1869132.1 hypothetical protein [Salmonella enterica]